MQDSQEINVIKSQCSVKTSDKGTNTTLSSVKSVNSTEKFIRNIERKIYFRVVGVALAVIGIILFIVSILTLIDVSGLSASLSFLGISRISSASGTLFFIVSLCFIGSGFFGNGYLKIRNRERLLQRCFCEDILRTTPSLEHIMQKFRSQLTEKDEKERSVSLELKEEKDKITIEEDDIGDIIFTSSEMHVVEIKDSGTQTPTKKTADKGV